MIRISIIAFFTSFLLSTLPLLSQVNAFDDDYLIFENEVGIGNVADNDILPTGQTAVYTLIEGPTYGTFNFTTGGNFEYTPPLNEFGFPDSIYYQVCVNGQCDVAGVLLYVIFKNNNPFAGPDYFSVELNTPRTASVTANDGDPDSITDPISTALQWYKFTNPTNGIVNSFSVDGTFTYTPNTGFIGTDSFQYYVLDHCGLYELAYVYLTVVGPNGNPIASDQTISSLNEDAAFTGALNSLVTDPENDAITFQLTTTPTSGTLQLFSNGSYTYSPPPNFTGNVSFTYTACDIVGQCDQGVVSLTVNNTDNDPPQLLNDNLTINEDSSAQLNVSLNDTDDSASITYTIVSQPTSGTVTLLNTSGLLTYTPNANYFGEDSFTVQACDGVNCATSTVSIQVTGINDAPSSAPFVINITEDSNSNGNISTFSDPENTALVFSTPNGNSIPGLTINANGSYQYIAPANYFGSQNISIQACDSENLCTASTFTLNVSAVNDLPVVFNDSYSINEDQVLTGNLSNGEFDIEGGALLYTTNQTIQGGSLLLNPNGQFTFTPSANWFGSQTIAITVCDSQSGCETSQLTINVASVNDAPSSTPANLASNEDQVLSGNLLTYCSDVENSTLTFALQNAPASGTLTLNSNGSFTYVPSANFFGNVSSTYQVCDANNSCVTGLLSISVVNVNDAPNAPNFSFTTNEDNALSGTASGITDVDNSNLIISLLTPAQHGVFTISSNSGYSYIPNPNYFGNETLTYQVCDALGLCSTGQFFIQVNGIQDTPQVSGESLATIQGNMLTGNLSLNDFDGDGDALTYTALNLPLNGTYTLNANGSFSYTANIAFIGTEIIQYTVCDNFGNCSSASLTIDVLTSNTAPLANVLSTSTNEDQILQATLLNSVTDEQGGAMQFTTIVSPAHGTITWNNNGSFNYSPNPNYVGSDSFTYQVCDNGGLCDQSQVLISVITVNDAPQIGADVLNAYEDENAAINIALNDADADGDPISYSIIVSSVNGIASLGANGQINYTPNDNYWGIDSIVYAACDSYNSCTQATLHITIASVNDAPDAMSAAFQIAEDQLLNGSIASFVSHADSEPLFLGTINSPEHGTLTISSSGVFSYVPYSNYFGEDQFTYIACDDFGACDSATVSINIAAQNDIPTPGDDSLETTEDSSIEINLAANDSDIENDVLTYALSQTSQLGTINLSSSGILSFTPNTNSFGSELIEISVCDAGGLCVQSSLTIFVESINDLPILVSPVFTMNEDGVLADDLASYAFDVEDNNLAFQVIAQSENGLVVVNTNGSFAYTPNSNFNGTDSFSIQVCDAQNGCTTHMINLVVLSVNDNPQSENGLITLSEDSATQGNLNDFASDSDNETLSYSILQQPQHGTIVSNPNGEFAFAPIANYFGLDSIQFVACDNQGTCDSSWIVFEVTFLNDLPIINNEELQVFVNQSISGSVASNDVELDNENLIYSIVDDQSGGLFVMSNDGNFTYSPALDVSGLFTVSYSACDVFNACDTGTITFFVTYEEVANTAPIALNFSGQACPGGSISIDLLELISDSQEESSALNIVVGTANSGSYQLDAETHVLTYQASQFASGTISFPYYICDNGVISMCDTATISIQISPSNPIQLTGFQISQIDCYGEQNGSLSISAQTNQGTVSYAWSNGFNQQSIQNLAPGNYSVLISSNAPCPVNQTAQFTITQPAQLIGVYSIVDANGSSTADSIYVSASGGTPGYSISWITPNGNLNNQWNIAITNGGNYAYTITDANDCQYSGNVLITSIVEEYPSTDLVIYPNPIAQENRIEIRCQSIMKMIEIYDSNGALISMVQASREQQSLDTTDWSSGIYNVRVTTNEGTFLRRIVKL